MMTRFNDVYMRHSASMSLRYGVMARHGFGTTTDMNATGHYKGPYVGNTIVYN